MTSYILGAARTPIGSFQGALSDSSAPELGAHVIGSALEAANTDPDSVDEVLMGCVISAGLGQAPARQAMRQAGVPDSVGATTVNKVCGSGMKAAMLAHDLIRAGSAECVVAGGMESMSNTPYLLDKARSGLRMGHGEIRDAMFCDGLEDAESGHSMGVFAQETADRYQMSREGMDEFAIRSLSRAIRAMEEGSLEREIAPWGDVAEDEQPRRAKPERIPKLRPAFKKDGTITAANASSISDGASALVIAAPDRVGGGAEPLARIVAHATHSTHPSRFAVAPVGAIRSVSDAAGWRLDDVDLFEINEAFAVVTMLAINELRLDASRVNIHGGACAQGHPLGSTGSRLLVTLSHALAATGGKKGIAALCIGGGEATAVAIERA